MVPRHVDYPVKGSSTITEPQPADIISVYEVYAEILDISRAPEEARDITGIDILKLRRTADRVWAEVLKIPPCYLPTIRGSVDAYKRALIDLRLAFESKSTSPSNLRLLSRSLDSVIHDLEIKLAEVRLQINKEFTAVGHSSHFFQNSHDFVISGGSFTLIDNGVDIQSTLHAHTQATIYEHKKTRRYIVYAVLFGRPRMAGCNPEE